MVGPVVLFAITDGEPKVTRGQFAGGEEQWGADLAGGDGEPGEEQYSTYLHVG